MICQNVSPIPSNRYAEAIFAIGIIKKVTGEKHYGGGVASTPPGRPRVKRAPNKHCQLDPAPTWIVKECGDLLAPVLSTMINGTFESGIFPDKMKHAVVRPILKKAGLDAMDLKS